MDRVLHDQVVAWCSASLPAWLLWEVVQIGDAVWFHLGSGALRQSIVVTPDEQLNAQLIAHTQMHLWELRDKCELAAVRLGMGRPASVPLSLRPTDPLPPRGVVRDDDHDD